jgi:tetratricopeptide (TPR) repeat protein
VTLKRSARPRPTRIPFLLNYDLWSSLLFSKRLWAALPLFCWLSFGAHTVKAQIPISSPPESLAIVVNRERGDSSATGHRDRIVHYLNTSEELRKSFYCRFTGQLRPVSNELQTELQRVLPQYEFHVAKMEVLRDPPANTYDLKVITDAVTGTVLGHVWDTHWTLQPSASFENLLNGRQAKTREDAVNTVKALAKLIAYSSKSEIGAVKVESGRIKVELISDKAVIHVLEVKINERLEFERLAIAVAKGKAVRSFTRASSRPVRDSRILTTSEKQPREMLQVRGSAAKPSSRDLEYSALAERHFDRAGWMAANNDAGAEQEYKLAIDARGGRFPEAWQGLSRAYHGQLRFSEAATAWQNYMALTPERRHEGSVESLQSLRRADVLKSRIDNSKAPRLDDLLQFIPVVVGYGGLAKATQYGEMAVRLYPNSSEAHLMLARYLPFDDPNQKTRQLELIEKAIELEPSSTAAHSQLGWYYFPLQVDESIREFRKALELSREQNSDAWQGLAKGLAIKGQNKDAIEAYRNHLRLRKVPSQNDNYIKQEIERLQKDN